MLARYSCLVVGTVFLFRVLARCSFLVAAFIVECGAGEHSECGRGILVQW